MFLPCLLLMALLGVIFFTNAKPKLSRIVQNDKTSISGVAPTVSLERLSRSTLTSYEPNIHRCIMNLQNAPSNVCELYFQIDASNNKGKLIALVIGNQTEVSIATAEMPLPIYETCTKQCVKKKRFKKKSKKICNEVCSPRAMTEEEMQNLHSHLLKSVAM